MPIGITTAAVGGLTALGIGAETAGIVAPFLVGGLEGAALGAGTSAITGGNIGKGALTGGLTGGALGGFGGAGGLVDSATGLGAIGSDALIGAAAGAAGSGITGGSALTGTLEGAAAGGITGALSPGAAPGGPTTAPVGGPGGSAASIAAPSSISDAFGGAGFDTSVPGAVGTPSASVGSLDVGGIGAGGTSGGTSASIAPLNLGAVPGAKSDPFGGAGFDTSIGKATGGGAPGVGSSGGGSSAPNAFNTAIHDPTWGNIGTALEKNAPLALGAASLGKDAISAFTPLPGEHQLKGSADTLASQGAQLQGYLNSGTLPPGVQTGIDQASQAAKATIRSQYASRGMSGSSAEAQDLAAVDARSKAQGTQTAIQLLQAGLSETQLSDELYKNLMNDALTQDQNFSSALTSLSGALAGGASGGGQSITIKAGG